MSNETIVGVNELIIRFEQTEDENIVIWSIIPDEKVYQTQDLSLMDLAECGAPISAIGIRALWKLCADGLVFTSLELANAIKNGVNQRLAIGQGNRALEFEAEGASIH